MLENVCRPPSQLLMLRHPVASVAGAVSLSVCRNLQQIVLTPCCACVGLICTAYWPTFCLQKPSCLPGLSRQARKGVINITALAALRPSLQVTGFRRPGAKAQCAGYWLKPPGHRLQARCPGIHWRSFFCKKTASETRCSTVTRFPSSHVAFQVITYGCQGYTQTQASRRSSAFFFPREKQRRINLAVVYFL